MAVQFIVVYPSRPDFQFPYSINLFYSSSIWCNVLSSIVTVHHIHTPERDRTSRNMSIDRSLRSRLATVTTPVKSSSTEDHSSNIALLKESFELLKSKLVVHNENLSLDLIVLTAEAALHLKLIDIAQVCK